jgi:hypothetical protein
LNRGEDSLRALFDLTHLARGLQLPDKETLITPLL